MDILRAYFSFVGRLNRADYALVLLTGYMVPFAILIYIDIFSARTDESTAVEVFLVGLLLWVFFAAFAKRLHDIGKPGWACFAIFIPIVGQFTPFILLFLSGNDGNNEYGAPQTHFFRKTSKSE